MKQPPAVVSEPAVLEGRAWLDGRLQSVNMQALHSPVDGRHLTDVAHCSGREVDQAVAAARDAFSDGRWRNMPPQQRKAVLLRLSTLLRERAAGLAWMETMTAGMCVADSVGQDLPAAARALQWSAEACDKLYGDIAPTGSDELGLITREALGVIAVIVPWNFPLVTTCWKLGPALAAGNCVILKPSEFTPLSAIALGLLAQEAGLPEGVLQVLPGPGETAGAALAEHQNIEGLLFTGSTATDRQLLIAGARSNMKRVWVECGGKSPQLVFSDCIDLDLAAAEVAAGIFSRQGQVCSAGSRLLVAEDIFEPFLARVQAAAATWQPGDPLDPASKTGVMISAAAVQRTLAVLDRARHMGVKIHIGAQACSPRTGSHALAPTILEVTDASIEVVQEELFAPVLTCQRFTDECEAIALANNSRYGLAAGIWSNDLNRTHRVAQALRAGSVWVNGYFGGDMTAPFGGFGESGNGRDKSLAAFDKVTELKATWIRLA